MNKRLVLVGIIMLAILVAGCSSSPAPVEYTIEMSEFAYSPTTLDLEVGQEVTLTLINNGALAHEFMVGKVVEKNADGQFAQYAEDFFASVDPVVTGIGEVHDMSEGEHMEGEDMDGEHMEDEHMEDDKDEMADQHDEEMGEDHGTMADHGFMVNVAGNTSGSETTIKFTVTEDMVGEWEMGCFLDGGSHYVAGMVGTITVSP